MLIFAILTNGFIIVYSCLDEATTIKWNKAFTNAFTNVVNAFTEKDIEFTPLQEINTKFSDDKYNYLEGYDLEQIPLGSAKKIETEFLPIGASNKAIQYVAEPADCVEISQSGSTASIIGMKVGKVKIITKSQDENIKSSMDVEVVDTMAPPVFEISLEKTNISIGTTQTIKVDVDGGVLGHDELINFRYYDTTKLQYSSSNEGIATVDKYGVIHPISKGATTISVSNGTHTRNLNVIIGDGSSPLLYSNLSISGNNVCFENDMILDQNSHNNHYQLLPKDGDKELNPDDFVWKSSNNLLVKVDNHGVMRGFRKTETDDETVEITAESKLTGQKTSLSVIVRTQKPTKMNYCINVGGVNKWNAIQYTVFVGTNVDIEIYYDIRQTVTKLTSFSSDESIASAFTSGNVISLNIKKDGLFFVEVKSENNRDLQAKIEFASIVSGAISDDDVENVGYSIRKSLGHSVVFMISQIFTFLTLFMFMFDKKWWIYSSISLGEGLFVSALSEFIQFLVPTRLSNFKDVLINFIGIAIGYILTISVIHLIRIIKRKRAQNVNPNDAT